jgi:dTDP-4-amino-4,6-dideoxygalactose transaminase
MTDFQGAVGSVQMDRLEWILEQRTRLAQRYDLALKNISWLRSPVLPSTYKHGYQSYVCFFQPEEPTIKNVADLNARRNKLMDELDTAGIATRPGTHAVHMLGFYREKYGINPEDFPNAYLADQLTLTLPLFVQMTEDEQGYVIERLKI